MSDGMSQCGMCGFVQEEEDLTTVKLLNGQYLTMCAGCTGDWLVN